MYSRRVFPTHHECTTGLLLAVPSQLACARKAKGENVTECSEAPQVRERTTRNQPQTPADRAELYTPPACRSEPEASPRGSYLPDS